VLTLAVAGVTFWTVIVTRGVAAALLGGETVDEWWGCYIGPWFFEFTLGAAIGSGVTFAALRARRGDSDPSTGDTPR
jgi:hypothetical protein